MKLNTFKTIEETSNYVSSHIIQSINSFKPTSEHPNFVLGLPTGSSPEGVYSKLIDAYKLGKVSFRDVITFNMDEYVGLGPDNDQSYHYFMWDKFFSHIDINPANVNILDGQADDLDEECEKYEAKIKLMGPIDLFMGGLGPEGHIAFNEKRSVRGSTTRVIGLEQSTIKANCRFFNNDMDKVPKKAVTVGISTILDNSKEIVIIVLGKSKQYALQHTINGQVGSDFPSTFLKEHGNVVIACDEAALGSIKATL